MTNIKLNDEDTVAFLKKLMNTTFNKKCADCNKHNPTWADVNFGLFVCYECAGKHRSLGPAVCKIKNTSIDTWDVEDLRKMYVGGNKYAYRLKTDTDVSTKYLNCEEFLKDLANRFEDSKKKEPFGSFMISKETFNKSDFGYKAVQKKILNRMGGVMKIEKSRSNKIEVALENKEEEKVKIEESNVEEKESSEKIEIEKNFAHLSGKKKYNLTNNTDYSRSPFIFKPDDNYE